MTPEEFLADFEARSFALLIGIDRYRSVSLGALSCAANDVRAVQKALIEQGGFAKESVTLLVDEEATRDAIFEAFATIGAKLMQARRKGGATKTRFWLYFAGHGVPTERRGSPETMLATYDAEPSRAYSGLGGEEIDSELGNLAADQTVLIFDCCHAGGLSLSRGSDPRLMDRMVRAMRDAEGRVTICSSKDDELAYEQKGGGLSVFANALIGGLEGQADPSNRGVIYLDDITEHLQTKVTDEARREHNRPQTPVIRTSLAGGSMLLSVRPSALQGSEKLVQKALVKLNDQRAAGKLSRDAYAYCEGLLIAAPPPASTPLAHQWATLLDFGRGELRPEALRANVETWMGPLSEETEEHRKARLLEEMRERTRKHALKQERGRLLGVFSGRKQQVERPLEEERKKEQRRKRLEKKRQKEEAETVTSAVRPEPPGFFSNLIERLFTYGVPALVLLGAIFGWDKITSFILGPEVLPDVTSTAPVGIGIAGEACKADQVADCPGGGGRVRRCVNGAFVTSLACLPLLTSTESHILCRNGDQRLSLCEGEDGYVVKTCLGGSYKAEGPCIARKR